MRRQVPINRGGPHPTLADPEPHIPAGKPGRRRAGHHRPPHVRRHELPLAGLVLEAHDAAAHPEGLNATRLREAPQP